MNILTDYDPSGDLIRRAETDEECARLKRAVEAADYVAKKTKSIEFLAASGNVEERKSVAESSAAYEEKRNLYFDTLEVYERMQNERETIQLRIDVWRSINANRRHG